MSPRPAAARRWWLLILVVAAASVGAVCSLTRRDHGAVDVRFPAERPQLIEIGMGICDQCRRLRPVMERAKEKLAGVADVHVADLRHPTGEALGERFELRVSPLIVLTDRDGRVLWRQEGFVPLEQIEAAVRARTGTSTQSM